MRIKLLQHLERAFQRLGQWAERMRERVAVCPACGRNRYTGVPCMEWDCEPVGHPLEKYQEGGQ